MGSPGLREAVQQDGPFGRRRSFGLRRRRPRLSLRRFPLKVLLKDLLSQTFSYLQDSELLFYYSLENAIKVQRKNSKEKKLSLFLALEFLKQQLGTSVGYIFAENLICGIKHSPKCHNRVGKHKDNGLLG